jgi:prepilin-type N-terminal cleavage/methylation domain-containing protein/prepilin-type processing-associated H-X9-DG protein
MITLMQKNFIVGNIFSKRKQKLSRSRNFTLIELLVVIAIIGILASMLLPALTMTRSMALTTVCTGQMKQIGLAFFAYQTDNDECLPSYFAPNSDGWRYGLTLNGYVPLNIILGKGASRALLISPDFLGCPVKQGDSLFWIRGMNTEASFKKMAKFKQPSETFLFMDMDRSEYKMFPVWPISRIGSRHSGGTSILFADGHVQVMQKIDIMPSDPRFYLE